MAILSNSGITGSFLLPFDSGSGVNIGAMWFDPTYQAVYLKKGVYGCSQWEALAGATATLCQFAQISEDDGGLVFGGYGSPAVRADAQQYKVATYLVPGSWSAGGALIQSRNLAASAGTQNAALAFGGYSPTYLACTEEYDGATESWTAGGALITARYQLGGAGTQDAGLAFGGGSPATSTENSTEEYTGATESWSAGGSLITGRIGLAGAGTQNSGLAIGGSTPSLASCTEEYDGSTWGAGGALITARSLSAGIGTQNAALLAGGYTPVDTPYGLSTRTEQYDGTSWSTAASLSICRCGLGGAGTVNSAMAFGGQGCFPAHSSPYQSACTEEFDGASWSTGGGMITARAFVTGAGSREAGLAVGGNGTTYTEEYTASALSSVNPVWANVGSLSVGRCLLAAAGTSNAGLAIGGCSPPSIGVAGCTEEFNGSSWSAGGDLITARFKLAGTGTQNAGLAFGGCSPTIVACTEEYDGSSWTAGGALITSRQNLSGAGTQNAGLAAGGFTPSTVTCTEEYDGTTWASGNGFPAAKGNGALLGSQNDALLAGGAPNGTVTYLYDGTNWSVGASQSPSLCNCCAYVTGTSKSGFILGQCTFGARYAISSGYAGTCEAWTQTGTMIAARSYAAAAGNSSAAVAFGGCISPASVNCTEEWNGSAWSAQTGIPGNRHNIAGTGTQNEALAVSGFNQPASAICTNSYEYNGSSWSGAATLIDGGAYYHAALGTQNAALTAGGLPTQQCTEEYNGSSWSAGGALISNRYFHAASGTQNDGQVFGGTKPPAYTSNIENYDGSTWSTGVGFILHQANPGGTSIKGSGTASSAFGVDTCGAVAKYNGTSWSVGTARLTGAAGNTNHFATGCADSILYTTNNGYTYTLTPEDTNPITFVCRLG